MCFNFLKLIKFYYYIHSIFNVLMDSSSIDNSVYDTDAFQSNVLINHSLDKIDNVQKSKNILNILSLNTQSLRGNKLNEIDILIQSYDFEIHILVFSEIWIYDNEIPFYNIANYNSYYLNRNHNRGGGCAIFVHSSINSNQFFEMEFDDNSILGVKLLDYNINLFGVYKPPRSDKNNFIEKLENILANNKNSILLGDFNLNIQNITDNIISNYKNAIISSGYLILNNTDNQFYTKYNSETTIDHAITDFINFKYHLAVCSNSISDHKHLILNIDTNIIPNNSQTTSKIKILNYDRILSEQNNIRIINQSSSIDDFIQKCKSIIETNSTEKIIKQKAKSKEWMTSELKSILKTRDNFYKLKQKFPSNIFFETQFQKYKKLFHSRIEPIRKNYYSSKFEKNHDPKNLWKTINELIFNKTQSKSNIIKSLNYNNISTTDLKDIVHHMNDFFINVIPVQPGTLNDVGCQYDIKHPFLLNSCDEAEISGIILSLKSNAANGYDGISTKFLKTLCPHIVSNITKYTNEMLLTGSFPEQLKIAKVLPLYKSGNKTDPTNYRPISILPSLSKILERVILARLQTFLITNNIISDTQYGFVDKSNTNVACINLVDFIQSGLEKERLVSALFIDLSKAFDSINHSLLLSKLKKMGLCDTSLKLFQTYLIDRKQFVEIEGVSSEKSIIRSGVPQGSILGPTLFNLFINDLCHLNLNGTLQLYADDMVVLYKCVSPTILKSHMQQDILKIQQWLSDNCLKMNCDKSNYIIFRTKASYDFINFELKSGDTILNRVEYSKYLGLIIDSRLNWHKHIDSIKSKLTPLIFALKRVGKYLTNKAKNLIYHAHFASHLNYLIVIWSRASKNKMNELRVIQNRMVKTIKNLHFRTHTNLIYTEFLNIDEIIKYSTLLTVFKLKLGLLKTNTKLITVKEKHTYSTRNNTNFVVEFRKTNRGCNSLFIYGLLLFNNLPSNLKTISSLSLFKKGIRLYVKTAPQP